ncbi:glycosyltransferase family 2 protein [Sphingobacterium multivorum]|uniref:glycosyltransferase family 2 protein n=1 Tax=Sphingobacterium multivorum TaxID=28454 RepID=UPI00289F3A23|nr:glycosyltransferase [Sphingobacterium multivorum]
MKISIIVPVFQVAEYIDRFMESLIIQANHENFELILIDDCGKDQSIQKAIDCLKEVPSINYSIITHEKNRGLSAARNSGIDHAQGDFIYFADSDDIIDNRAIEYFLDTIANYSDHKLFCFNASFQNIGAEKFSTWRQPFELPTVMTTESFSQLLYSGKVGAYVWQYLFHKNIFKNLRFEEGAVWEDAIFLPQVLNIVDYIISLDHLFIYKYILRTGSITQTIHPQMDKVVLALNDIENKLYPYKNEPLYPEFVNYKTNITMRLSRECFSRTKDFNKLMSIHRIWAVSITKSNIKQLMKNGKKKSAVFLGLLKTAPEFLYFLYAIKVLK